MPFKIDLVVFFAVLIFGAYSASPDPEKNKENNSPSKLHCYFGSYTSENILNKGISPYFVECPNGSSCFVSKTEGKYTFGCGGNHPEIENGNCSEYFEKIYKTNEQNVTKLVTVTTKECHCNSNKCLNPSILGRYCSPDSGFLTSPRQFDISSFFGGIILTISLCAIGLFVRNRNRAKKHESTQFF